MSTRAQAKSATRDAIVQAAIDTFMAERSFAVTLPAIASRANVTVKTILRHFGSRDALIEAAWSRAFADVVAERRPPRNDPPGAVRVLLAHYERLGEMVLAILADENEPRAAQMNRKGRATHRQWVEDAFAGRLPDDTDLRSRVGDVLVVATDVYCWKLLRFDRGLSVDDVHDRMLLMVESLLAGAATNVGGAGREAS
ncbi:TetR/AcrR family transcriptional regulator [Mycolicibacterium agri]|nr:TetR/AcrR family transcriptional regulator [Mycolicibacterium agri]